MLAEDGSGKGAGLVGAIAQRINARNVNSNTQQTPHVNGKTTNNGRGMTNGHTNGYSNGLS
jgi:hypothetical protein